MIATITLNPAIDQTVQLEKLHVGAVNKVHRVTETAGGKGINVARVLADLGAEVLATGLMGNRSQAFFQEYFSCHNVIDAFVTVEGAVRSNIKLVDQSSSDVTDVNFPGFDAKEEDLKHILEVIKDLPENAFVAVCGSLPPGISADAFEHFLRTVKSMGFRLAIDTSGEALQRAVAVKPDLIKPNIHELSELAGRKLDISEAIVFVQELLQYGVGQVVLSCGADGAWFLGENQKLFARPGSVNVVSTVGAGDSMMAACLYGLSNDHPSEHIARQATACGMKAVSQAGVGGCSIESLSELLATVEVSNHGKDSLFAGSSR